MVNVKELTKLQSVAEYFDGFEREESIMNADLNESEKLIVKVALELSYEPDESTTKVLNECLMQLSFFVRHLREFKEELSNLN